MFRSIEVRIASSLLVAAGAVTGSPASAQNDLQDRYWIEGSAYWANVDSKAQVRLNTQTSLSTEIDFENDLDLSNRRVLPSISLGTRRDSGWIIGVDIYSLHRNGSRAISRDIVFDGVTYPASAEVSSSFNSDIYRLTVGYAFVRSKNFELVGSLGLHATNFDVSLTGDANVGGQGVQTQVRRRKLLAPVPTIGLMGTWQITDKLAATGRIDYLSLKIDPYDGRLVNVQASLGYRVLDKVGVGVMYRYVDYRLGVNKDNWQGTLKYRFSGPAAFVRLGF